MILFCPTECIVNMGQADKGGHTTRRERCESVGDRKYDGNGAEINDNSGAYQAFVGIN
jgi:hypothetical protein